MLSPEALETILGANGVIGRELSKLLLAHTDRVRQVGRSPRGVNPTDELVSANLLDADATSRAVAGSEVAYLVAGLRYDAGVWEQEWPRVMQNAIDACAKHRCKLVFFDNVYAYGRVVGPMTEDTPFNPSSRKGEVRARIATTLLEAIRGGGVDAMIVRAADFYGPGAILSLTHAAVFERLRAHKTPQWVGSAKANHSFTYTPDAARTVAELAHRPTAWGKTWHALTSPDPMSGETFVRLACELAQQRYRLQVAPGWMLRLLGLFNPVLRENQEMMYQFEFDYQFDSTRVQTMFGLAPTPYREGIATTWGASK
jgi:nucleoside-diphosphate-sugar epimerase